MVEEMENDGNDEFYEGIAQVADFVHDRLGNVEEPTGLNNTVEEYVEDEDESKE